MRRYALTFTVCLVGICAPAAAKASGSNSGPAPAGNSGVTQYVESIPTDKGNRPTNPVHSGGNGKNHQSAGAVGGSGGGGTGGGGTGAPAGSSTGGSSTGGGSTGGGASNSAISSSTQKALASRGADGKAAAAVAIGTAPALFGAQQHNASGKSSSGSGFSTDSNGGSSALSSVAAALTGSGSNGGMGAILPVILIVVLFGSAGMAILRHRRHT
jgi:hypothetical protein